MSITNNMYTYRYGKYYIFVNTYVMWIQSIFPYVHIYIYTYMYTYVWIAIFIHINNISLHRRSNTNTYIFKLPVCIYTHIHTHMYINECKETHSTCKLGLYNKYSRIKRFTQHTPNTRIYIYICINTHIFTVVN